MLFLKDYYLKRNQYSWLKFCWEIIKLDNVINVIEKCILLIGVLIDIYIFYRAIIDKIQIKKDKKIKIRSNKYVALITINMILFLICGFIRNFK